MQALPLNIETFMKAQVQVPIITPSFPTCDKYGIVHGPEECTIADKQATTMDEINFDGEETILIISTLEISIKDMA